MLGIGRTVNSAVGVGSLSWEMFSNSAGPNICFERKNADLLTIAGIPQPRAAEGRVRLFATNPAFTIGVFICKEMAQAVKEDPGPNLYGRLRITLRW